jgi:ABC-2 type transport system permease protein
VALVAAAIPLTLGMDAMRQVLFRTSGLFDVWVELGVLAALALAFFLAARRALRYLERRAREDGKLTIRWQ